MLTNGLGMAIELREHQKMQWLLANTDKETMYRSSFYWTDQLYPAKFHLFESILQPFDGVYSE